MCHLHWCRLFCSKILPTTATELQQIRVLKHHLWGLHGNLDPSVFAVEQTGNADHSCHHLKLAQSQWSWASSVRTLTVASHHVPNQLLLSYCVASTLCLWSFPFVVIAVGLEDPNSGKSPMMSHVLSFSIRHNSLAGGSGCESVPASLMDHPWFLTSCPSHEWRLSSHRGWSTMRVFHACPLDFAFPAHTTR